MGPTARLKQKLLLGPLLKIERAKKHVSDLSRLVDEYLSGKPFQLRIRQRRDPPDRVIYVDTKKPIPEDFALIAGDAVHNLGSALDHLCWGMVRDKAPNKKAVGFPFAKAGAQGLTGSINSRQMNVASKHVIDEFHRLKPYPGGNKYLYAVKSMDETDKHHVILLVTTRIEFTPAQFKDLVGADVSIPAGARIATAGDFLVSLDPGGPIEPFDREADFQPPFAIGFGQEEALENEPVIPALKAMIGATEDAVRRVAAAYFR